MHETLEVQWSQTMEHMSFIVRKPTMKSKPNKQTMSRSQYDLMFSPPVKRSGQLNQKKITQRNNFSPLLFNACRIFIARDEKAVEVCVALEASEIIKVEPEGE